MLTSSDRSLGDDLTRRGAEFCRFWKKLQKYYWYPLYACNWLYVSLLHLHDWWLVLKVSSLFLNLSPPPVLAFGLGRQNFLHAMHWEQETSRYALRLFRISALKKVLCTFEFSKNKQLLSVNDRILKHTLGIKTSEYFRIYVLFSRTIFSCLHYFHFFP